MAAKVVAIRSVEYQSSRRVKTDLLDEINRTTELVGGLIGLLENIRRDHSDIQMRGAVLIAQDLFRLMMNIHEKAIYAVPNPE